MCFGCVWMLWVHPKNVQVLTMLFPCILSIKKKIFLGNTNMHLCKYAQIWLHTNISSLNGIECLSFFNSWFPRWVLVMIYKLFFHKFKENCVLRKSLDAVLIAAKFHFLILSKFEKINFCIYFFISIVHLKVRLMMLIKLLISAMFYSSNMISQIEYVVAVLQSKQSQHLTKIYDKWFCVAFL